MPADRDLRLSMLHKWKARARCCVCAAMAIICAASYLLVLALQVLALQEREMDLKSGGHNERAWD